MDKTPKPSKPLMIKHKKNPMKKLTLFLFVTLAITTLSSFTTKGDGHMTINTKTASDPTPIGYQLDDTYYYTFAADLGAGTPFPLTAIHVQRLIGGAVLPVSSFSGAVQLGSLARFFIVGTATVTFVDNGVTITKSLTGLLQGGLTLQ